MVKREHTPSGPTDRVGQLWVMAFYPERGVASRPFYLRADLQLLHAPIALR